MLITTKNVFFLWQITDGYDFTHVLALMCGNGTVLLNGISNSAYIIFNTSSQVTHKGWKIFVFGRYLLTDNIRTIYCLLEKIPITAKDVYFLSVVNIIFWQSLRYSTTLAHSFVLISINILWLEALYV